MLIITKVKIIVEVKRSIIYLTFAPSQLCVVLLFTLNLLVKLTMLIIGEIVDTLSFLFLVIVSVNLDQRSVINREMSESDVPVDIVETKLQHVYYIVTVVRCEMQVL